MAKKRDHRRRSGRFTPKARDQHGGPPAGGGPVQGDGPGPLMGEVRTTFGQHPIMLLHLASALLEATEPANPFERSQRSHGGASHSPSKEELLGTFLEVDEMVETSALLAVMATLGGDELLRGRVRRELDRRGHAVPAWTRALDGVEVTGVYEMVDLLGDGDNVMVGVALPSGESFTQVVYIDHNMGTVVKDAFALDRGLDEALTDTRKMVADTDTDIRPLDPADARVRIAEAVDAGEHTWPPFESETWPGQRPLVKWICSLLPAGGQGYAHTEWSDDALAGLAEQFFASPAGRDVDDEQGRFLIDPLLWFASSYGQAKPLNWSSVRVEILLTDWFPRKVVAPATDLDGLPRVLRAFIRFAGAERGLPDRLVRETLEAVDAWEGEYRSIIRTDRLQGAEALADLARRANLGGDVAGVIGSGVVWDDDDEWDDEWDDDLDPVEWQRSHLVGMLADLAWAAGGEAELETLSTESLPDEDFDWAGISEPDRARVGELLGLCDRCCDEVLDARRLHEHRTACRRLLRRIAVADPSVLARGKAATAAAAVCWVVAKVNHTLDPYRGGLTAQDLLAHFGLKGSVSSRANTMLGAIGSADNRTRYGDGSLLDRADYLVSTRRAAMIDARDHFRSRLAELDPT